MSNAQVSDEEILRLASAVAADFARLPGVVAVAMAGSRGAGWADDASDVDLYVYSREEIPVTARAAIASAATQRELDNRFWEPGDEWIDRATGLGVDVMYRAPEWIEDQLNRSLVRHEASIGYSTCFWHSVRASRPLFDPTGWYRQLHDRANRPYPEELRRAIVAKNYPILRDTLSSYRHQLALAAQRGDRVSLCHRTAALLASYFDVLFALNRVPHPGEKRLVAQARALCSRVPDTLEADVAGLLQAITQAVSRSRVTTAIDRLIDGLDLVLLAEGLPAQEWRSSSSAADSRE